MSYAIIQFTCTKLGDAAIKDYEDENTHELAADEIKSLWLISQYQSLKDTNAKKTINAVETDFQKLYLSVNLSRLVAMKLIVFNPKAQEKPVEKEKSNLNTQRATSAHTNSAVNNVARNNVNRTLPKKPVNTLPKKPVNTLPKRQPASNNNDSKVDAPVTVNMKKKPSKVKKVDNLSDISPAILLAAGRC